jgi:hypothetical protein
MGNDMAGRATTTDPADDDPAGTDADTRPAGDAKITGTDGDADTIDDETASSPAREPQERGVGRLLRRRGARRTATAVAAGTGDPPKLLDVPAEVRRYVRRPLWWIPAALALGILGYALQLDTVQSDEWVYGDGEPLTAVVAEPYDGPFVPLVYDHPVAGPTAVSIPNPDSDNPPEPGQGIAIRAHRTYPDQVRLASDTPDPAEWWMPIAPIGLALLVVLRRWWSVRRTVHATAGSGSSAGSGNGKDENDSADAAARPASSGGPTDMVGKLRPRRRSGRTVVLDLYTADKPTELPKRPVISVPLVSTLGLPVGGRTFKVQVHGRARRMGRVVAEVGDGLLWPRRRGLLRQRVPGDLDSIADRPSRALPVPALETRKLKAPKQLWPEERLRTLGALGLVAGAVLIGVLGTMASLGARDDARHLPPGAELAAAQVTGLSDAGLLEVAYQHPDDDAGEDPRTATVGPDPVTNPAAWSVGVPVVVVVENDSERRVTLPPEPYRVAAPIVGGWLPTVVAGAWLVRVGDWRRRRQAADVTGAAWYPVEVRWLKEPIVAEVRRPRAKAASCVVTLPWGVEEMPVATTDKLVNRGQQVYADAPPAPGNKLVLRTAGRAYVTVNPATLRDQRWRRRWRFIGKRR